MTLAGALVVLFVTDAAARHTWKTASPMTWSRRALAAFFSFTGSMHFVQPGFFEAIVPPAIESMKKEAVVVSGIAEIAGAVAVLHPATRRLGRWGLLGLLLAVFPANVHMAVNPEQVKGLDLSKVPRWALWARLPLQPLAMLWVWRATRD